jgi:hypothetical protein
MVASRRPPFFLSMVSIAEPNDLERYRVVGMVRFALLYAASSTRPANELAAHDRFVNFRSRANLFRLDGYPSLLICAPGLTCADARAFTATVFPHAVMSLELGSTNCAKHGSRPTFNSPPHPSLLSPCRLP